MHTASRQPLEPRGDGAPQRVDILAAGAAYTPEAITGPVAVAIAGGQIRGVWRGTDATRASRRARQQWPGATVEVTDLGDWALAPGYIDLHDHGFIGYDVTTGTREDIEAMARALPRTGVTAFLPTIATTGPEETRRQIRRCVEAAENRALAGEPAAAGIPCGVCGELAGDPRATALLLGLGVTELSMSAGAIGYVKREVRATPLRDAQELARDALACATAADVLARVNAAREAAGGGDARARDDDT